MKVMLAILAQFVGLSGGSERVCCQMANALHDMGYEVSIVYSYGKVEKPYWGLHKEIKLYNVMEEHSEKWHGDMVSNHVSTTDKFIREILRLFNSKVARNWNERCIGNLIKDDLKSILDHEKPDLIISYWCETSSYLINDCKINIPVITMFHVEPKNRLKEATKRELNALNRCHAIQVLLPGDMEYVKKYCPHIKTVCIPNTVPQYEEQAALCVSKKQHKIIYVARLEAFPKNQHFLIESFAKVAHEFPDWIIELWGQEENSRKHYREYLEKIILNLGLKKQVFLCGTTKNILEKYLNADFCAFPSLSEGFALAMTEAMSAGLPVVGLRECKAISEIVEDGKSGLLATNDTTDFSKKLYQLMQNQQLRVVMGRYAKQQMAKFAENIIWEQWDSLIKECKKDDERDERKEFL